MCISIPNSTRKNENDIYARNFIEPEFIPILFCLTMDDRISPDFYMVLTENANFNNFDLNINVVKKKNIY